MSIESYLGSQISSANCRELRRNASVYAHNFGFSDIGIQKHTSAATAMSIEARANGGGVPKMRDGGITASLQSIGASGYLKDSAAQAIHDGMVRGGIKRLA
jgi:hypothetical protein